MAVELAPVAWAARPVAVLLALLLLQIVAGAFVAGLDAGMGYNTWPLIKQDPQAWKQRVEAETQTKCVVLAPGGTYQVEA